MWKKRIPHMLSFSTMEFLIPGDKKLSGYYKCHSLLSPVLCRTTPKHPCNACLEVFNNKGTSYPW